MKILFAILFAILCGGWCIALGMCLYAIINEDPLYISVLRDSKRIVRKAEEEVTRQQTEIESLKENRDELWEIHCRDTERYLERIDEIDALKEELKTAKSEAYNEFAERLKEKFVIADCIVTIDNNDIDNLAKEMVGENND